MKWITKDDCIETYSKLRQRGLAFILSKFNWNPRSRTLSAFDQAFDAANWWMIPAVKSRWNFKITGDETKSYEDYTIEKYFSGRTGLKILSLGSGICSHELILAKSPAVAEMHCVDIASHLLEAAAVQAKKSGLNNVHFHVTDIKEFIFEVEKYDVIFFHASLHHFAGIDHLLGETLFKTLKPGGLIILNEYVGPKRMQFPAWQIEAINHALKSIPIPFRKRLKTNWIKTSVSGPGYLRMWLADPSECVESDAIMPALHLYYSPLEIKPYGGNLLMLLFKDIAHHFVNTDAEKTEILNHLFELEDRYLQDHDSDFVYAVFKKGVGR